MLRWKLLFEYFDPKKTGEISYSASGSIPLPASFRKLSLNGLLWRVEETLNPKSHKSPKSPKSPKPPKP